MVLHKSSVEANLGVASTAGSMYFHHILAATKQGKFSSSALPKITTTQNQRGHLSSILQAGGYSHEATAPTIVNHSLFKIWDVILKVFNVFKQNHMQLHKDWNT